MYTFIVVVHVLVSVLLIMVVLLQSGKGAGMGAAFGGGSQTLFGARGQTTFMHKLTAGMAILFMALSVVLATLSASTQSALEQEELPPPGQEAGMVPDEQPKEEGAAKDEAKEEEESDESDKSDESD
jgi:preprotein translocase subunit SecG